MNHLLAIAIDGQKIAAPKGIPSGGLPTFLGVAQRGVKVALAVIIILSIIFVIVSGIKWVTAGGDKTKVQSARATLTYAILGLALGLLSFIIVSIVGQLVTGGSIEFLSPNNSSSQCLPTDPGC